MTRLGDICVKIGSGATPKGGKEAYMPSGIPIIRSQNILDWSFADENLAFIDNEQADSLANVEVMPGDVLVNITGDSVARACLVPSSKPRLESTSTSPFSGPESNWIRRIFSVSFSPKRPTSSSLHHQEQREMR